MFSDSFVLEVGINALIQRFRKTIFICARRKFYTLNKILSHKAVLMWVCQRSVLNAEDLSEEDQLLNSYQRSN